MIERTPFETLGDDAEALPLRTGARVLGATLKAGETTEYTLAYGRYAYLVPATGKVELNGVTLHAAMARRFATNRG
jgi:redox-sensitive bicupin YhaK (pirin superfamily)